MDQTKEQEEEKKEENNVTKVDGEVSDRNDETTQQNPENEDETPEKINWKKFREKRAKEQREAEQARIEKEKAEQQAALLKEALKNQINKQESDSPWNPDEDYIKKSDLDLILRERLEKERAEQESANLPSRLKSHMPDFDQVCTEENTAYLEYHHPEIAEEINDISDPFKKWRSLHRAIKTNVPNYTQSPEKNRQKIEKNLSKPQSSSTISDLGKSEIIAQLSEEQKRQNWKKIMEITGGTL